MSPDGALAGSRPSRSQLSEHLIAVATNKDVDAFRILFSYFAPRVKAYLLRCGAPPATAEDVAQDVMLAIWRNAAQYDPARGDPSAWVFGIARNGRLTVLRHERRPNLFQELPKDLPSSSDECDTGAIAAERRRRLASALRTLPPEQTEMVRLSFFEDRSHSQIERKLGIPLGTIKSHIRRAILRLRAVLDDEL